jgi:uncharacterized protein YbjT (DUF2867 family)
MTNSDEAGKPDYDTPIGLALVTGASSGIGRAFARRLAADGYDLIVVGRRKDRLDELAAEFPDVEVRPLVADLGTDAGVQAVADVCASEVITLLVNNAGVAHYMAFTQLPAEKAGELLHVKVIAPTMLARAAASSMVTRRTGTIINGRYARIRRSSRFGKSRRTRSLCRNVGLYRRAIADTPAGTIGQRCSNPGALSGHSGD